MKTKPLLLNDFSKMYGKARGVDDISLSLNHGEIFGFLGPNGSGKSTTIRTIMNYIDPSSGTISVFGLDSVKDSVAIKHKVGYLAGDIALYENMTGKQLLSHLGALSQNTDWAYVAKLASRLEATLDKKIYSLSKGNKQKLGLIQAFMDKPDLLILDEPTSGLDPIMKHVFYDMVQEMRAEGKTVFVSSHDLTEVQQICDRVAFIRKGKLIAIEEIKDSNKFHLRRYNVRFENKPKVSEFEKISNVSEISVAGNTLSALVSGNASKFIIEIANQKPVDLDEQETSLEDIFIHYYENQDDNK